MKNLFNPEKEVFNKTKRLNKKPKIIIITLLTVMLSLVFYVIFSSGVNEDKEQAKNIEVLNKNSAYKTDDEFVKNLANNGKQPTNIVNPVAPDDFREKLDNKTYLRQAQITASDNKSLDYIPEDTLKTLPIPISKLDDNTIIMDRENSLSSVHLTTNEITAFRQKRFENLDEALQSPTSVYNISRDIATKITTDTPNASNQQPLTYQEQLKEAIRLTTNVSGDKTIADNSNRWTLENSLEKSSPHTIKTGSIIPATLITEINSSVQGTITAQVRQNVYDTATGNNLLVPQGTRLVGDYSSDVPYGKERLFISWKRMVLPDGTSLDIEEMPGVDMAGRAGVNDKVNNHYDKIFGNALLLSVIVAGVTLSQKNLLNNFVPFFLEDTTSALSESLGQNLGETMSEMIRKNLNIAPEITIRAGYLFNIIVVKDITLPIYGEIKQ